MDRGDLFAAAGAVELVKEAGMAAAAAEAGALGEGDGKAAGDPRAEGGDRVEEGGHAAALTAFWRGSGWQSQTQRSAVQFWCRRLRQAAESATVRLLMRMGPV
jgi:hypothetical protein